MKPTSELPVKIGPGGDEGVAFDMEGRLSSGQD